MNRRRLLSALMVFMLLAIVFSGLSGFASATQDPEVFVPEPNQGDSASYSLRQVISDPDLAQGDVVYNWMRLVWDREESIPDASGITRPFEPLRFHLKFREGSQYERDHLRTTYHDPVDGDAFMDEYISKGRIGNNFGVGCISNNCVAGTTARDTHVVARNVIGPEGVCGARSPLHGATEIPKTMDVEGYCRDYRIMGSDDSTPYELVGHTTWKDRDAVEYRMVGGDFRLIYAEGISFPVLVDLPLGEYILEPYNQGRHYTAELRGFTLSDTPYPSRASIEPEPVALVPRVPVFQIDESQRTGFTLRTAYEIALADPGSTELVRFMASPESYLGLAWKLNYVDGDGRPTEIWSFYATDGRSHIGKSVTLQSGADRTGLPLPGAFDQYTVGSLDSDPSMDFPRLVDLPAFVPDLEATLERSAQFPGVNEPNLWGFFARCMDPGCTDVQFAVRAGEEALPSNEVSTGAQAQDPEHQHTVFFDQTGFLSHTWSMEAERGQPGLLPINTGASTVPANDDGAQGDAAWLPPAPAAAASLGFLAFLGAAAYYFWPALKVAGVGMFTRIRDDDLLNHPRRREVHDAIQADPGIHFQALSRNVGGGRGSLDHHLRKLQQGGLVVRQETAGRTSFFPKGAVDRRVMQAAPLLRAGSTRSVLDLIAAKPGSQCADVAAATGLSNPTVSYHLGKLRKAGLVAGGRSLTLTDDGAAVLAAA